jgi:hypothetical protein
VSESALESRCSCFKTSLFNVNDAIALVVNIRHKCSQESGEIGKNQTNLLYVGGREGEAGIRKKW